MAEGGGPLYDPEANADYIVAAANSLPALLDERDALLAALRAVEWGDSLPSWVPPFARICPTCHRSKEQGHAAECAIGAALASGGGGE